jgi:hypothetical protein
MFHRRGRSDLGFEGCLGFQLVKERGFSVKRKRRAP